MKKLVVGLLFSLWTTFAAANVPCSVPFNLQNGTVADATQVMANYNALITCLGNAAAAGANSDITSLLGLTTPIPYTAGGSSVYIGGTSTGTANAQAVASLTPLGFSLTQGFQVIFKAGFSNTASPTTFNFNGTGAKTVVHPIPGGTEPLTGGEIQAGAIVQAIYDGTNYQLIYTSNQLGGIGPVGTITASTNTVLFTASPNHNVRVSGNTNITSFGVADLNFPQYFVEFSGTPLISYNQSNCATTGGCIFIPGGTDIQVQATDTAVIQYISQGSSATPASGNWSIVSYQRGNGTAIVNPTPLCGAVGLKITNNAGTPSTQIDWSFNQAVMINPTGNVPISATATSNTINLTNGTVTSAPNGMDGEARGTSAWIDLFLISNGSLTAGLASSTNGLNPTMPAGYTYKCYVGAMRVDGGGNLLRTLQVGADTQYTATATTNTLSFPNMQNGIAGSTFSITSPTLVTVAVAGFVPPTATVIRLVASGNWKAAGVANVLVAPTQTYSGANNGPGGSNGLVFPLYTSGNASALGSFVLETTTISYAADGAGGAVNCAGWRDAVNAN